MDQSGSICINPTKRNCLVTIVIYSNHSNQISMIFSIVTYGNHSHDMSGYLVTI